MKKILNLFLKKEILHLPLYLISILFLALFLRLIFISTNPPSLTWDEAALGYNAYSLGIDGKDEFGRFLPYDYLESFGDFKPPMYSYLSIIPVKIFGLNEFSTRFASAFFGSLTVLVTYFLVINLFTKRKSLAAFAALFLALSPWHIMLSRAAFEANVSTFFVATGVWLFVKGVWGRPIWLMFSVASFVASAYTFNSSRIVAPIILLCMAVGFREQLLSRKKYLFLSIILGIILVLPISNFLLSPQASLRFKEVNIFSDTEVLKTANQEIVNDRNVWWSKIIHNRRIVYGREFVKHYLDNLNPKFLFTKGDGNPKFSPQTQGQLYMWDLPFFVAGFIFLFRKKEKNWWILPLWMCIGIIPAALARETPHALRIAGSLPTFQIITGYGLLEFAKWLKNKENVYAKLRVLILPVVGFLFLLNVTYFLHGLFVHYPREQSGEWQYGYKESLNYAQKVEGNYDRVYFSHHLGRPYIYTLFYNKYDPHEFRQNAEISRDSFGFVHVTGFGKYAFPEKFPEVSIPGEKALFITEQKSLPATATLLKTFYLLNGKPILQAYTL